MCLYNMHLKGGTKVVLITRGAYYHAGLIYEHENNTQGQNEKYFISSPRYALSQVYTYKPITKFHCMLTLLTLYIVSHLLSRILDG